MANDKIVTIGLELASDDVGSERLSSRTSLLDWDIIIFKPDFVSSPSKEETEHWSREIEDAADHGKVIFIYLPGTNYYLDESSSLKSGINNYDCIPLDLTEVPAEGRSVKISHAHKSIMGSYWSALEKYSRYSVTISDHSYETCFVTKSGDKTVGLISKSLKSPGAIVCLPDINFDNSEFTDYINGEAHWSKKGEQFAKMFIKEVVKLSKAIKMSGDRTTPPEWLNQNKYDFKLELLRGNEIKEIEEKVKELNSQKDNFLDEIQEVIKLKDLLFETGKTLEGAILKALEILGFQASQFDDGESEYDAIFISDEGRFLGEAEGKDRSAIDIQKFRQLNDNIQDDQEKNELEEAAKGVLFGNGYRLLEPEKRNIQFTDRCIRRATSTNVSLVATSELFKAVYYLSQSHDDNYARLCRRAILDGSGIVDLPDFQTKFNK